MKYLASVSCSIIALSTILLLFITYINKKKNKNLQNVFIVLIMICCFLSCISEFIYTYCIYQKNNLPMDLIQLTCKTYIVFMLFSLYFSICYVITIKTNQLKTKKRNIIKYTLMTIVLIIYIIAFFIIINTPIHLYDDFLYQFNGNGIIISISICDIIFLIFIFIILTNNNLTKTHKLPLFFAITLIIIILSLQLFFNFDINHQTLLITFLLIAIYFTTENQDFKLLEELEKSKKIAEEENIEQTKFLGTISQIIKTPMNTILGTTEILLIEPNLDLKTIKKDIINVDNAAKYLLDFSNNISTITKIDTQKEQIIEQEYTIQDIINEINNTHKNNNVNISIDINNPSTKYYGDINKIIKIVNTILNNIMNYTNDNITLKISETEKKSENTTLTFTINSSDHIITNNINEESDDFYKINNPNSINNNMLDLIIAKKLTKLLNGEIIETSDKKNWIIKINQKIINPNINNKEIEEDLL